MLGFPGSGKSTVSKMISKELGIPRINSDELRKEMFASVEDIRNVKLNPYVFGALDYMVEASLRANISVIYDANNNRIKDRNKSTVIADKQEATTIIVWVKTPLDTAKERDVDRRENNGHLSIPEKRYNEIVSSLQQPLAHENTIIIDGLSSHTEQMQSFRDQFNKYSSII